MRGLLSTVDLSVEETLRLLDDADRMKQWSATGSPRGDLLKGRTVASVFFEDSTRTRISFETAAKRLSADVMSLAVATSSVNKGESLRDTVETLGAMGVDAWIVRHRSSGVPWQVAGWTSSPVINAGDGWHQHPTQALLDAYTISRRLGTTSGLTGVRIAIVGDIRHSRVARSNTELLMRLGAEIVHVAPATLSARLREPSHLTLTSDLDEVIGGVDVLYMLRIQRERLNGALLPSIDEYCERFALTPARAARLGKEVLVMHPGPMNRGVEMQISPEDLPGSVILDQVANGVAVRMAVLNAVLNERSGAGAPIGKGSDQ